MSKELPLYGFGGDGGASLNFEVTAYATEAALLAATPAENTIGVITTTAITSWLFGAEEPDSPAAGMVWITTGTSSAVEFNALKKNGVMVYPLSAKQYVDGEWIGVTAKSYQGGAWVDWIRENVLYDSGDENEAITGGWVAEAKGYSSGSPAALAPVVTRGEKFLTMHVSDAYSGGIVRTKNKIDLSKYSTIVFDGAIIANGNLTSTMCNLYAWSEIGTYQPTNAAAQLTVTAAVDGQVALDVSSLNGEYYVGFGLYSSTPTVEMRSMILE